MSQIVAEFVEISLPALERMVVVLERARTAPAEVRAGLLAAVERAEREVIPDMLKALGQGEMFMGDLAYQAGAAAGDERSSPRRARPARKPSTPVPVTRGSGGPRKARKG
jgi:hypothetical protein